MNRRFAGEETGEPEKEHLKRMPTKAFVHVRDTNRKPIRGLWQRGSRYYLQLREPGARSARRIPLDATNLTEAKQAAEGKRREARKGSCLTAGVSRRSLRLRMLWACSGATKNKTRNVERMAIA
jgi:hypothetical protein